MKLKKSDLKKIISAILPAFVLAVVVYSFLSLC